KSPQRESSRLPHPPISVAYRPRFQGGGNGVLFTPHLSLEMSLLENGDWQSSNCWLTLVLQLREAYHRLRESRQQVYQFLTRGWDEATHQKLRI
ncbi:MAG: hypothetical protein ACO394_11875, partial [Blastocatellia bacterium]